MSYEKLDRVPDTRGEQVSDATELLLSSRLEDCFWGEVALGSKLYSWKRVTVWFEPDSLDYHQSVELVEDPKDIEQELRYYRKEIQALIRNNKISFLWAQQLFEDIRHKCKATTDDEDTNRLLDDIANPFTTSVQAAEAA